MGERANKQVGRRAGLVVPGLLVVLLVAMIMGGTLHDLYLTGRSLQSHYDGQRQESVLREVVAELWLEALYRVQPGEGPAELSDRISELLSQSGLGVGWEIEIQGGIAGDYHNPWSIWESGWELLGSDEREGMTPSLGRWTGIGGPLQVGTGYELRIVGDSLPGGEMVWWGRPLRIPVTNHPLLVYDLSWDLEPEYSVPLAENPWLPYPEPWVALPGTYSGIGIPYRLREQLEYRTGIYPGILEPGWHADWWASHAGSVLRLELGWEEWPGEEPPPPGVTPLEAGGWEIELGLLEEARVEVSGAGRLVVRGQTGGDIPLLLLLPGEGVGEQVIEVGSASGELVGPVVFHGWTSWRAEEPRGLRLVGVGGSEVLGGVILGPGAQLQVPVRGHLGLHASSGAGYPVGYQPPITGEEDSWLRTALAAHSPRIVLWDIGRGEEQP